MPPRCLVNTFDDGWVGLTADGKHNPGFPLAFRGHRAGPFQAFRGLAKPNPTKPRPSKARVAGSGRTRRRGRQRPRRRSASRPSDHWDPLCPAIFNAPDASNSKMSRVVAVLTEPSWSDQAISSTLLKVAPRIIHQHPAIVVKTTRNGFRRSRIERIGGRQRSNVSDTRSRK